MNARDIMTTNVVTVTPETTIAAVAALLLERRISGVPVVDRERVAGIVSESDLLAHREIGLGSRRAAEPWWACLFQEIPDPARYVRSHAVRASDVMSTAVASVAEDTRASKIAALFEKRRIRRAPVLRAGRLVGIVTRADLVRGLALPAREARLARWQSDDGIREQLLAELGAQAWWRAGANVLVNGGVVHFLGVYDSDEARHASRVAAENIPGVRRIEDHRVDGARLLSTMG